MHLRSSPGIAYGLLDLAVSLASFWPVLLGYVPLPVELITGAPLWGSIQGPVTYRQFGVMEDLVRSFYPAHKMIGEAIRSGTIPLWNPYVLNGFPMHAALAYGVFAPFTMLSYVVPIDIAWTLGMVLEPAIAALGTALYGRALGLSHGAALSAGFVFGWCGFQAGWAGQAMIDVSIWLPWARLPSEATSGSGTSGSGTTSAWRARGRALGGLAAVAVLATLLSAIQT